MTALQIKFASHYNNAIHTKSLFSSSCCTWDLSWLCWWPAHVYRYIRLQLSLTLPENLPSPSKLKQVEACLCGLLLRLDCNFLSCCVWFWQPLICFVLDQTLSLENIRKTVLCIPFLSFTETCYGQGDTNFLSSYAVEKTMPSLTHGTISTQFSGDATLFQLFISWISFFFF